MTRFRITEFNVDKLFSGTSQRCSGNCARWLDPRERKGGKEYGLRCETQRERESSKAPWLSSSSTQRGRSVLHVYRPARCVLGPSPRVVARRTRTAGSHANLARSRTFGGTCTHTAGALGCNTRTPLSVHARIRLLIGAWRGRLGSTKFGTPTSCPGNSRCIPHFEPAKYLIPTTPAK